MPLVAAVNEAKPSSLFLIFSSMSRGAIWEAVMQATKDDINLLACCDEERKSEALPLRFRKSLALECVKRVQELQQAGLVHSALGGSHFLVDRDCSWLLCSFKAATRRLQTNKQTALPCTKSSKPSALKSRARKRLKTNRPIANARLQHQQNIRIRSLRSSLTSKPSCRTS